MIKRLGPGHAILAVVLAGAIVTYGGVSLFVAFFVLAPMAQNIFRSADIPRRLMPAAIVLGTSTFTMSALPGTPSIQNAIPMPFFGTTPFAAPGLGVAASAIMLGFGLWWLGRAAEAVGELERAVRLLPGEKAAHLQLADACEQSGNVPCLVRESRALAACARRPWRPPAPQPHPPALLPEAAPRSPGQTRRHEPCSRACSWRTST